MAHCKYIQCHNLLVKKLKKNPQREKDEYRPVLYICSIFFFFGRKALAGHQGEGEGGWVLQREESPIAKLVMEQFITINQVDWRFS